MERTEIPEKFKSMSTEEIIKEIYENAVKNEEIENKTRMLAVEALAMQRESNLQLRNDLRLANKRNHELIDENIKLSDEKIEESRRLVEIIERTQDKIYDIGMEIAKRIQALEDLKGNMEKKDEKEKEVIDLMTEMLLDLSQYVEYRLIPIPLSKRS